MSQMSTKKQLVLTVCLLLGLLMWNGLGHPGTQTVSATGNYSVAYTQNDWGSGATVSVTITNTGPSAIASWELIWTFSGNQKITNLWNGAFTQNGTSVTVSSQAYNSAIAAHGGTVSFGFNLSYSGANLIPASFTLNGISSSTATATSIASTTITVTPAATSTAAPTATAAVSPTATTAAGVRLMENLDRGLIAIKQGNSKVYVGWRLLGTDPSATGFNLYRITGSGAAIKLNSETITTSTNYVDNSIDTAKSNTYYVKPVLNGIEQAASERYTLAANAAIRQYIPIPLKTLSSDYYTMHVNVGDLDGDGKYDYIVKRMSDNRLPVQVEAYNSDGTFLWRIDLGVNIETYNTAMTSPLLVADFDCDGKAEVMLKTAEGTRFGNGDTIGDTDGDGVTNYRDTSLSTYQVLAGPEFISMVNGLTGAEIARTNFIAHGKVSDWGDNYGNRMSFIFATVAYLDGQYPSAVFSRGPGDKMKVVAWNFRNGAFTQVWSWNASSTRLASGVNFPDFHAIRAVDVDGDGKDELSWGGSMLDHDGKVLYGTELVHGDRFVIGDINPDRSGLECYAIQQNNANLVGAALYDAGNGKILKRFNAGSVTDVGRGDCGDIDPNYKGMEVWSAMDDNLYDCEGNLIGTAKPYPGLCIWWDGDLLREFLDGIGNGGYSPAINKWNYTNKSKSRLYTIYNEGVRTTYAGRPPFYGDILGDWREELILETADRTELRIYTTTNETNYRLYTLMHNPAYRNSVDVKGYLSSVYPDYYLGVGMSQPPLPKIYVLPRD